MIEKTEMVSDSAEDVALEVAIRAALCLQRETPGAARDLSQERDAKTGLIISHWVACAGTGPLCSRIYVIHPKHFQENAESVPEHRAETACYKFYSLS